MASSNASFAPLMQDGATLSGTIGITRIDRDPRFPDRRSNLNNWHARTFNLETQAQTLIRSGSEQELYYYVRLSPDGKKVAYRSTRNLIIADADGQNPVTIPNQYPSPAGWSPDSKHIVYAVESDRLYMIDANGQNKRPISWNRPAGVRATDGSSPTWSPDGTKIYYMYMMNVPPFDIDIAVLTLARNQDGTFVLNSDGSIAVTSDVQLTSPNDGNHPPDEFLPAVSPDGTKIAFRSCIRSESAQCVNDIYLMNADGTNKVNLTNTQDYGEDLPVWSPDGTRIAFTKAPASPSMGIDYEIIAIKTDGTDPIRIPTGSVDDSINSWIDPCAASPSSADSLATYKSGTLANQTTNTPRCPPKELIVNNTTDDEDADLTDKVCDTDTRPEKPGPQCSLRAALDQANFLRGLDVIKFDIPGPGVHTITATKHLPTQTYRALPDGSRGREPVYIDGSTQPGYNGSPLIEVKFSLKGDNLDISHGSTVKALVVPRVHLSDTQTSVLDCYVGINPNGTTADPNPDLNDPNVDDDVFGKGAGISVSNCEACVVEGNVISNHVRGITLFNSSRTKVRGNKIGTDKTGQKAIPNRIGIYVFGSHMNPAIFGDAATIEENVISGNLRRGIYVNGQQMNNQQDRVSISKNLIGTKADGTGNLSNGSFGMILERTRSFISGNVIVGHNGNDPQSAGILISEAPFSGNQGEFRGNYIGVAKDGVTVIPNKYGIIVKNRSGVNIDGFNVISGNTETGILITGTSSDIKIGRNFIGTDINKTLDIGNGKNGIWLSGESQRTEIYGNDISGNGEHGILLSEKTGNHPIHDNRIGVAAPNKIGINLLGSSKNLIVANVVANSAEINISLGGLPDGPNTDFTEGNEILANRIENGKIGIALIEKARNNTIGQINNLSNIPNTIINHRNGPGVGIYIGATIDVINDDFLPNNNKIIGNRIGEPKDGAFSNRIGVLIAQAQKNFIGGQFSPDRNFINANELDGIRISGPRSKGNLIGFNSIGIDDSLFSEGRSGNGGNGISIDGAGRNDIRNNAIGYNRANGISVSNLLPQAGEEFSAVISGNQIGAGQFIYTNNRLDFKAGNGAFGVRVNNSQKVLVGVGGNSSSEPRNIISGNGGGVLIEGVNSKLNLINNSIIGTTETGGADVGNAGHGIYIFGGGENTIGGAAGVGNVIASNGGNGVAVEGSVKNKIYGNRIGVITSSESNVKLGNGLNGILILNAAETEIGKRFTSPLRNIIGGNTRSGIVIQGADSRLTNIKFNYIGTDSSRTNLGNGLHGILITDGGRQVTVGGREDLESGNTIAFNNAAGAHADPTSGNGIYIDPNSIFNNVGMGIEIGAPGPNTNDFGDADLGPNRLQNHPEIISRRLNSNNEFIISYRVTSAPGNSNYGTEGIYIEFFRTDAAGEGEKFLGFDHYTVADYADGAANAREVNLGNINTLGINPNDRLTASATDADGNTSEFFGDTGGLAADGSVQLAAAAYTVNEGAGKLTVTVTRTGPASGAVTASYSTTPGTATTEDYTHAAGSVTFADGDLTPKTFDIQITDDSLQEGEESFKLNLSITNGSAALGTPSESTITITDNEAGGPTLDALSDLTINEDAPLQTINLSGISAGAAASQSLSVTATSSNTGLIPNPSVSYSSPNTTGFLSFTPVANQSGSALITVTVTKVGGSSNDSTNSITRAFTVTVDAVNDTPINIVPGAQSTNQGGSLAFSTANNNSISIADVDAGANSVQVTLITTNGTLSLSGIAGLNFTVGDGTADATTTFTGTLASINAALSGPVFTPTSNFTGAASLQITTNDQGNTGTGGALSDTDTVSINVGASTFQFSAATYVVGEAGGHATITVTRSGDVSQPASIKFQAEDLSGLTNCNVVTGNASQRCDFTAGGGALSFSAGQTSATFMILIIDDVYVEGPETLHIILSNPPGGILGTPSTATLTITDNDDAAGAPNPIDQHAFFIRQQYLDFLVREPEPEGLQYYLDILKGCQSTDIECLKFTRGALSANFFRSPEFQQKGSFVMYLYMITLGQRPVTAAELTDPTKVDRPHYTEFMMDLNYISDPNDDKAVVSALKDALTVNWLQRPEIQAIFGGLTNEQFVQKLESTAGVTLANRNTLIANLDNATQTRAQVLRAVAESPEVNAKFYRQAFVTMEYFGFLRRDPEDCHNPQNWGGSDPNQCGYIFHNNRFNSMSDPNQIENVIVRGFIESPEYRQRFGP